MPGNLLVVDDDEPTCELLAETLRAAGHRVAWETSGEAALEQIQHEEFSVVLTDLGMPGMSGLELCRKAREIHPRLPVVVLTGRADLDAAIGAMRSGAYDFITKPIDNKLLLHQVDRAVEHGQLGQELKRLRRALAQAEGYGRFVGQSKAMRGVYDLISRVGPSDAAVLILGESGTGKELAARAIHDASPRAEAPFVALNCAAVPGNLIESELFGHVRGAFTDARRSREGLFAQANGGTLFLDEIGDLPLDVQPKLLRALQEQRIRPVGGNEEVAFDARIVTATNVDLEQRVQEKAFREDLLYRIDVVRIELPPLRARGRDVLLLAQRFLDSYRTAPDAGPGAISEAAAAKLVAYDWPGNVRELENCIQRAVALARHDEIAVDDLPKKIRDYESDRLLLSAEDEDELITLDELEARYIRKVLKMMGGNKSRTARALGLDRRSLYRRLEKYDNAEG